MFSPPPPLPLVVILLLVLMVDYYCYYCCCYYYCLMTFLTSFSAVDLIFCNSSFKLVISESLFLSISSDLFNLASKISTVDVNSSYSYLSSASSHLTFPKFSIDWFCYSFNILLSFNFYYICYCIDEITNFYSSI